MSFTRILGLLAFVAPMSAQTVWSMGSPHTDLAAVITSAAPGDIVLLNGMQFANFTLTKGLTMIGPGTIRPPALFPITTTTAITVPVGESAHFVDIDFTSTATWSSWVHTQMVVVQGDVTFEECSFYQGSPFTLDVSGNVMMRHCSVSGATWSNSIGVGTGGGMRVNGGVCHLADCHIAGNDAGFSGQIGALPGSPALRVLNGSMVHVSQGTLIGGDGLWSIQGFASPQPALIADGTVVLTDSSVSGGSGLGGWGLRAS